MKLQNLVLALGLAGLGVLQQVSSAKAAVLWNWSYQTQQGDLASGTWETDGTEMTDGQTYTISSITGTLNSPFGIFSITNLNNTDLTNVGQVPDQQFTYTPSDATNKFKFSPQGILYNTNDTAGLARISLYDAQFVNNGEVFYSPTQASNFANGTDFNITRVTQTNTVLATPVPWDFSPAVNFAVVPLFIGLSTLKKKRLARKSTAIKTLV